jgi:PAS domain S-box-containing protein
VLWNSANILDTERNNVIATIAQGQDITERKQVEEALRISEARYRLLVENANETILVAQDGMLKFVNQMTVELFGYSEQELTSRPFPEFVHPDDRGMVVERHIRRLKGDVFQPRYAFRLVTRDGSIKWVEIGAVLIDWEGRPATLNFITDITERKQANIEMNRQREILQKIFDHIPVMITYFDKNGKITMTNHELIRVLGWTSEEWKTENILVKCYPEPEVFKEVLDFMGSGKIGWKDFRTATKYGTIIDTAWTNIFLSDGVSIGIGQDITERKRAEEVLRESEEKWRSLVSILPDYVSLLDREDRFLFLNRYAEGFTEKEIIGSSVYQYLSTQSKEIFEKEIAECQNTGKIRKFEHTAMGDHGIMREYEDYLVPLLEKNKVTSTLVISRDITERKQAELLILIQRDLALAISSSHQIDEALSQCLDTIIQLSEMDCGGIYLIDQASGDLNLSCHRNLSPTFIKSVSHYKADSTHARLVLQGKPLFIRYSELDLPLNQDELAEGLRAFAVLPLIFENRVIGCLNLASKKLEEVSEINREVLKVAATLMGEGITRLKIEEELKLSNQKLQKAMKSTIQATALILEKRDPYNAGHQKRMTKLACAIAEEISLPKDKVEGLYIAGIIHDIGKINVPTEILSKPGRLSEIEFSLIQTHPQVGSDLLKEMELPGEVSSIVLQHHERMDGSGYPSGLSGEAILLEARILAVTDVVEAMASNRPYRPALGLDQALEEITKNKGKLYDPEVVDACWKLFKEKGFKFE